MIINQYLRFHFSRGIFLPLFLLTANNRVGIFVLSNATEKRGDVMRKIVMFNTDTELDRAYIAHHSVSLNLDGCQQASKRLNAEYHRFSHEHLFSIVQHKPTDFEPYGFRKRNDPDCSCGCRWYLEMPGKLGADWGVRQPSFAAMRTADF